MKTTKAVVDFSNYKAVDLVPAAGVIHERMSGNAVTFPEPPGGMDGLLGLIGTYRDTLAAKSSRARADVLAFRGARKALESALRLLGGYVNYVAKGDGQVVEKSGFPSYEVGSPRPTSAPAAPENVRLRHGPLGGSIVIRCKVARLRGANQVQVTTGSPAEESGWVDAGVFTGGRTTLTGLPVGAVLWVRIRTSGAGGVMGNWSDPARIVVI